MREHCKSILTPDQNMRLRRHQVECFRATVQPSASNQQVCGELSQDLGSATWHFLQGKEVKHLSNELTFQQNKNSIHTISATRLLLLMSYMARCLVKAPAQQSCKPRPTHRAPGLRSEKHPALNANAGEVPQFAPMICQLVQRAAITVVKSSRSLRAAFVPDTCLLC